MKPTCANPNRISTELHMNQVGMESDAWILLVTCGDTCVDPVHG